MIGNDYIGSSSNSGNIIASSASIQAAAIDVLNSNILYSTQPFFVNRPKINSISLPIIIDGNFTLYSDVKTEIDTQLNLFKDKVLTFSKVITFSAGINIGTANLSYNATKGGLAMGGNTFIDNLAVTNGVAFNGQTDATNRITYSSTDSCLTYSSNNHLFNRLPSVAIADQIATFSTQMATKGLVDLSLTNSFITFKTSAQIFSGAITFSSTILCTSMASFQVPPIVLGTLVPAAPGQLTPKSYVDSELLKIKTDNITYVGLNTYTQYPQVSLTTGLPTMDLQFSSKLYVDNQVGLVPNTSFIWKQVQTFNVVPNLGYLAVNPTVSNHVTSKQYVDAEIGKIRSGANVFLSTNQFNKTPTLGNTQDTAFAQELITKYYYENIDSNIKSFITYVNAPKMLNGQIEQTTTSNEFITKRLLDDRILAIFNRALVVNKFGIARPSIAGETQVYFDIPFPGLDANTISIQLTIGTPSININGDVKQVLYITEVNRAYFKYRWMSNSTPSENIVAVHWTAQQYQ